MNDPAHDDLHRAVDASYSPQTHDQVAVLLRVIAAFDAATARHLEAVGELSMHLALAVGFDYAAAARTKIAARLHDIGKITISRAILFKAGPLTADEWSEIRRHPHYGATTLAGLPLLSTFAPIVLAHHERIDGKGYPDGRRWDEIPLESQIIAVADAFHAMTVPRPYSAARLPSDALAELRRCAGSQFNSAHVHAFGELIERRVVLRSA